MSFVARRIVFTGAMIIVAAAAASAGVLAWRTLNPPPVELVVSPPPPAPGPAALRAGDRRPDFTLADTEDMPRSVSEWDGKLLIINFWATWCPPCLEEIPGFVRLQDEYAARGVQFLGVALDGVRNVRRFMAEQRMNYPSLHGERDAIALGKRYGNRFGALPYTVLVAPDGTVLRTHQGILREDEARRLIEQHS